MSARRFQNLMVGNSSRPPSTRPLPEPLSESELRVLRYLPTNLTAPESPVNCLSRATR